MENFLDKAKWKSMWKMLWLHYQIEKKRNATHLEVDEKYLHEIAVFDFIENRTESNINTHRTIWIPKRKNGKISETVFKNYFKKGKELKIHGKLNTLSDKSCLLDTKVEFNDHSYEIVSTDLNFYSKPSNEFLLTGGILTGDWEIKDHVVLQNNTLSTGNIIIRPGGVLEIPEGITLSSKHIDNFGVILGSVLSHITMNNGSSMDGILYGGSVTINGRALLQGMYYGDNITVSQDSTLHMKQFGSLTTALITKKGAVLEFEDAEPLVMEINADSWTVNEGKGESEGAGIGTNTTGESWYLNFDKNPTDMLGNGWLELKGNGVPMPASSNIGVVKMEKNLKLVQVNNTEHNYALMLLNEHPITNIVGEINVHAFEGTACPPEDKQAISFNELSNMNKDKTQYSLEYYFDNSYMFKSAESIALQASTKPVLLGNFKDIEQFGWHFAKVNEVYTWFGYEKGIKIDHWDGPFGPEKYIIRLIKSEV